MSSIKIPSDEQAKELLKQTEQKRIDDCSDELEQVLIKHNCIFAPQIIIRGNQIIPQILILPNPTKHQLSTEKNNGEE